MNTAYSKLILVTEVKLRIVWREFVHSIRTTLEGKVAVATMVATPFLMTGRACWSRVPFGRRA